MEKGGSCGGFVGSCSGSAALFHDVLVGCDGEGCVIEQRVGEDDGVDYGGEIVDVCGSGGVRNADACCLYW